MMPSDERQIQAGGAQPFYDEIDQNKINYDYNIFQALINEGKHMKVCYLYLWG